MSSHFVYTPSEFRKNMRAAFGFAEAGATVVIDRYGEKFVLVHKPNEDPTIPDFPEDTAPHNPLTKTVGYASKKDVEKIKSGETTVLSSKPTPKKNIRLATPINLPHSTLRPEPKYCKAGHLLSPNGRCLQKGCKYA